MEISIALNNRREFIKTAALAGLGIGLLESFISPQEDNPPIGWNDISSLFIKDPKLHYLNTGTLGLSPKSVINAYTSAIAEINTTGKYDKHEAGLVQSLAEFIKCTTEELVLTKNVTEGINIAAWSVPLKEGDEIVLCTHEHAGNALPWLNRAKRDNLKIVLIELGKNGNETLINIAKVMSKRTKVIALPHIPCTIGNILPIKEICSLAKAYNCYSCIDGAHGPGMLELDMKDIGCDFYASCFHKWMLGPKGSGFLYIRAERLPELETYFVGAHSTGNWSFEHAEISYEGLKLRSAHRYYYGTQSDAIHAASKAAIDFLNTLKMKKVEKHISEVGRYLCNALEETDGLEVLNSSKKNENAGIISFRPRTKDFRILNEALLQDMFRLRVVSESGIDCIRVSTHIYNNKTEVDALVDRIAFHLRS